MLFLSDTIAELDAAGMAGMATRWCVRERAPVADAHGHAVIRSFGEVFPG
jgi:methionine salvage enolase-phosphatase E1